MAENTIKRENKIGTALNLTKLSELIEINHINL
jgi:hypothetical protein